MNAESGMLYIAGIDWLPVSLVVWSFHMLVFHGAGLVFNWCDRTGALRAYKVRGPDRFSYGTMLPRVLGNQILVLLPAMLIAGHFGLAFTGAPRLGPTAFIGGLLLMAIGHDVVQYGMHRGLLHSKHLRWLGHDIHHRTGANASISACYMSAPDFFLNIVCPYLLPLILIGGGGSDLRFHFLVAGMGALGGLYEHSGYDFAPRIGGAGLRMPARLLQFLPSSFTSSHAHGEHHRRWHVSFSDGFGSPGLCDWMFRTRWDLL